MKHVKQKILSKYEKKQKQPSEKLHPQMLFTCKNTKIQGVKNIRNNEQIIKNLLYVMLINLEFFLATSPSEVLEKKVISKY